MRKRVVVLGGGFAGINAVFGLAKLPRGERDIPLMLTDRSFAADGTMPYPAVDPDFGTPGVTEPPYSMMPVPSSSGAIAGSARFVGALPTARIIQTRRIFCKRG